MSNRFVGKKFGNINGSVFLCFDDNGKYIYVSHYLLKNEIIYHSNLTDAIKQLRN